MSINSFNTHFTPTPAVIFQTNIESAKRYCIFKFKQETQFNKYRKPLDLELKQLMQDLMEEGLSSRKVNSCRVMFEKSLDAVDVYNPSDKPISNKDRAQGIFEFIVQDFGKGNASSTFKSRYYEAEDKIISYYTRYYDIQDEIKHVKDRLRIRLNELKNEILNEGVPYELLQYVYKRLKTDIEGLKKVGKEEFDHFDSIYKAIKDDMIEEAQNV